MDKQTFLAEIRATHEPIAAAVARLSDDAWAELLPDMAGWTRKDALAHVGWWSDHSARVITALRAGRVPYERSPDFDINAQNRSILDESRVDRRLRYAPTRRRPSCGSSLPSRPPRRRICSRLTASRG